MAEKKKGSTTEIVRALAEPLAKELGLIIWDVTFTKEGADWYLRIFIDKEGGVGIDDCVDLTRAINPVLDSEDPIPQEYTLEVSSTLPKTASLRSSPRRTPRSRSPEKNVPASTSSKIMTDPGRLPFIIQKFERIIPEGR